MWKVVSIYAENLCAFKELDYTLLQNQTTLIFGNNLDNDSQASNGSGKSALIEALAVGLTGETLRKVKMEEIINDSADGARVVLTLSNDSDNRLMTISRKISRQSSQEISVSFDNDQPVVQSSVSEYNKFVLETIGLSKGEIYSNFVLSKHKYISFLSSSDKDKKEIINRFSNGVMVDESIAALQADMAPLQEQLKEAEEKVATNSGRTSALEEQINKAITESNERHQKKEDRLKAWKESIVEKRSHIRDLNESIDNANDVLDQYDALDEKLQEMEGGESSVSEVYSRILQELQDLSLPLPKDYASMSSRSTRELASIVEQHEATQRQQSLCEMKIKEAVAAHSDLTKQYESFEDSYKVKSDKIDAQINALANSVRDLESKNSTLKRQSSQLESNIAGIQKQLAGVIACPKCKHEFTLSDSVDIPKAKEELQDKTEESKEIALEIDNNLKDIEDYISKGREARKNQNELIASQTDWSRKITASQTEVDKMNRESSSLSRQIRELQDSIATLQKSISNSKKNLFDDVFEILDDAIKSKESAIKQAEIDISNANGAILSYQEYIKDLENSSDTEIIESLKNSKDKYDKELELSIHAKESVERNLNLYKVQEATFIEFKTHLANTKIDALSHITNEFLEAIGSDIRIAFSGYTVLKTGKIRDKISISLIRDGVDCGSFDKFSEGEKARVNLANILAMHKLTNVNCLDGKGLDLLVLDEILEATDESGLASIFEALNSLQITSLVVSHGNIAENYPYKLVVSKKNNVSFINEKST